MLEELIDVLLRLSGGWFVLDEALAEAESASDKGGQAWAEAVIAAIHRVRARGYAHTPMGTVYFNEPVS